MGTACSQKQARIENDLAVKQEGLGYRCYTFCSSDEQRTAVAFWEAKPWDPNAITADATITLPLAGEPRHVFLYDLLSGNQVEIPWKHLKENHLISIAVSNSGAPQVLIVR